jgi:polar amino acid transport system substrate-binding protein
MKTTGFFAGLTWWVLATASSAQAGQAVLVCDDRGGWPPYTFVDPKNPAQVIGASKELVFGILERAGYTPTLELLPWKRCLAEVESGRTALLLNASYNEERAQKFHMTKPYYNIRSALFYRTSKYPTPPQVRTLDDMKAYRYCGLHGYNYTMYSIPPERLDTGAKDEPSRMTMLRHDRCDFVLGDMEPLRAFAAMGLLDMNGTAHIPIPEDKPKEFYAMVSKALPDGEALRKILDDGFTAAKADKTYAKIFSKYGLETN